MNVTRQDETGRWVPDEGMPTPFGVRWERAARHERILGHSWPRAWLGGFLFVLEVNRTARRLSREKSSV